MADNIGEYRFIMYEVNQETGELIPHDFTGKTSHEMIGFCLDQMDKALRWDTFLKPK